MAALGGSVSRRYARALFAVGSDNGRYQDYGRDLESMTELLQTSAELRQALENPVFKPREKRAIIQALLPRVTQIQEVHNFCLLLLDRGRLGLLPLIARDFRRLTDEKLGQVRGKVVSAAPLDEATFDRVRDALARRTGKKVILERQVNPELLGGVVAQVGDLVIDGSLRNRLDTLTRRLLN